MSRLPPGPRSILLQTLAVARDPFGTFQKYARRYGDPFTLTLCTGSLVLTGTPEGIREILTAPLQTFASNSTPFLAPLFGERSVLLLDGAAHARERAVLTPPFHGMRLQAYGRLTQEVTLSRAEAWRPGQIFPMQAFAQALALEVMLTATFGPHDQEQVQALARTIPAYFKAFTTLLVYFPPLRRPFGGVGPWRRFTQVATHVDQLLFEAITARRREAEERDDILSFLLEARAGEGRALTDAEVRDEVITLLLAGHETIAIALSWAFYWLHRQPDVLQRVQTELRAMGLLPSPDDLVQLPYLRAASLRAGRGRPRHTCAPHFYHRSQRGRPDDLSWPGGRGDGGPLVGVQRCHGAFASSRHDPSARPRMHMG